MSKDKFKSVYELIIKKCSRRLWTSAEFALKFGIIKFTNRVREMIAAGHRFIEKVIFRNGVKYKGYQYIGKKAA